MRTLIFFPALPKMSGGMRVLVQLANQLIRAGMDAGLVINGDAPSYLVLDKKIRVYSFKEINLFPDDRWIVPEGWPNALAPGLKAGSHCCVFVQNWMPFHGMLPDGVSWRNLPVSMLAVSHPIKNFIKETIGRNALIIPPAIDHNIFYYDENDKPDLKQCNNIRIACMPRKNKAIITEIQNIIQARALMPQCDWYPKLQWLEIHKLPINKVGEKLRGCHLFLSAGFPEGFGLPPLEAMACGCLVAGFTGLGGWEYMRGETFNGYHAPFALQDVDWGNNGFYAADGDVWGGAMSVEQAMRVYVENNSERLTLLENDLKAARWYSEKNQYEKIVEIWEDDNFWNNVSLT